MSPTQLTLILSGIDLRLLGNASGTSVVPGTPYLSPGIASLCGHWVSSGTPYLPPGIARLSGHWVGRARTKRHPDHRATDRGRCRAVWVIKIEPGLVVACVIFEDGRAIKQGAIHPKSLIPKVGLEPAPSCADRILNPARVPPA